MNVIITGASKGIGKAIAETFAAKGHTLLLCARYISTLEDSVKAIQHQYPQASVNYMQADLADYKQVQAFANWCLSFGMPHVLINNTGQYLPGSVLTEPDGTLQNLLNINLMSAYHLTRLIAPKMMEQKKGHIFNICSIASVQAYANGGAYSISKFALLGFSKNLREELKPHGVKVTAVIPGAVYTDSWVGSGVSPERIMQANDIASMIECMANLSPQACVEEIVVRPQLGDL